MNHDQDDLLVPPDRRPLVYGGAAIVILLVAAFLFWPRGGTDSSTQDPLANKTLVPPGSTTQASDESVRTNDDTGEATLGTGAGTDLSAMVDDATSEATGTPTNPRAETKIIEDETPAPKTTEPAKTETATRSTPSQPSTSTSSASITPSATGNWVLNVGSFSSRENADRRAKELARQGIDAHVQLGTSGDGSTVYRVRVGYFDSSSRAKEYGTWLKSSKDLDSWAGQR